VKQFSACLAAILVAVFLVASPSSRAAPPPEWPASLTIATASPGGVFVIYGQAMAQIFTETLGLPVSAQVTQGRARTS
jgi:uncharacterized protein